MSKAKPDAKPANPFDAIALIASLDEQSITDRIASLENELEALRVLQKAKHIQAHGKPPRKSTGPRKPKLAAGSSPNGGPSQRERIIEYLRQNAPAKGIDIANGADIPPGSVGAVLSQCRGKDFEQTPDGWRLMKGA